MFHSQNSLDMDGSALKHFKHPDYKNALEGTPRCNMHGYGTVRSKTSSSREDSLQNHFSNGTVHPGTVRSIC